MILAALGVAFFRSPYPQIPMTKTLIPIILAGGKGERFWPLSRKHRPKQFLSLDGTGVSLLQATAQRLLGIAGGWENVWVITSAAIADGVREQLPELPAANLLVEPEGRDTAAAVAWATLAVAARYGNKATLGFFPADHHIADEAEFNSTLQAGATLAAQAPSIVTLGISPDFPATGYGYIQSGAAAGEFAGHQAYRVNRFTEKPDRERAEEFIQEGNYTWNSGMFIFTAQTLLDEMQLHAPEILEPMRSMGIDAYGQVPKQSIDYALMEKTQLAYVLPVSFGWDDLGDWNAIERLLKGDEAHNPNVELAQHIGLDTAGAILYCSSSDEVIVTIGLENVVVVRDGNVTLVVDKNRTQEIKGVLGKIKENEDWAHLL
jgi:mannose-1-phosphate guanylyltransferase